MADVFRAAASMHKPSVPAASRAVTTPVGAEVRAPIAASGYSGRIVCVGASTGGTEAIKVLLQGLPQRCPPILIVQHMPESFTPAFAKRLDSLCQPRVVEALAGDAVVPGTVY